MGNYFNPGRDAAAGYFANMAASDQRQLNAFNLQRTQEMDAFNRSRTEEGDNRVRAQWQQTQLEHAVTDAVDMMGGGVDEAAIQQHLDRAADQIGVPRNPNAIGMIRGRLALTDKGDAYGNPIYIRRPDGSTGVVQLTKSGRINQPNMPQGASIIDPVKFMNTGGYIQAFNSRNPQNVTPVATVTPKPENMPGFQADVVTAKGAAEANTPLGKNELDKAEREKQDRNIQLQQQSAERMDVIESIQSLLDDPALQAVYGSADGLLWTAAQSSVDAEAKIARVNDLLTMTNLGRMKGVLSDTDIKILTRAGSILGNRRISANLAKQEMERVIRVMWKYEDLANGSQPTTQRKSSQPQAPTEQPLDPALLQFMTPEEQALFQK